MLNRECSFVARIESAGEFLGTGTLVGPQYVVTCYHVVAPKGRMQRDCTLFLASGKDGVEQRHGTVEAVSPSHDLALLRLDECAPGSAVRLIRGLTTSYERSLSALEWRAFGHSERDATYSLRSARVTGPPHFVSDHESGVLMDAQVHGGFHNGFSGGPVLLAGNGGWICLGVLYLGGEGTATSRIVMADCIVGFLEGTNIGFPEPLPAGECIEAARLRGRGPAIVAPAVSALAGTAIGRRAMRFPGRIKGLVLVALMVMGLVRTVLYFEFRTSTQSGAGSTATASPVVNVTVNPPAAGTREGPTGAASAKPGAKRDASTPPGPLHQVRVFVYAGAGAPAFRMNGRQTNPDDYLGGVARFSLPRGAYNLEADYAERICSANFSVPGAESIAAECHLK